MSLSQALTIAVSGLRVTQNNTSVVAANIANAETPNYTRKELVQETTVAGDLENGVRTKEVQRQLDILVQRQIRVETSGASYAAEKAAYYSRLETIYGQPGGPNALNEIYNGFTSSLQELSATPESQVAQQEVISYGLQLAQKLNSMTQEIQALRSDAEFALGDSVEQINFAIEQIASTNEKIVERFSSQDSATAGLLDIRDGYINQLSSFMDIKVVQADRGQVNVFSSSGILLVGTQEAELQFDSRSNLNPTSLYTTDASTRGVGTLALRSPNGSSIDLIAENAFRTGSLKAWIEMRDEILVEAQNQVDAMAANLAKAMSEIQISSTAAPAGPPDGLDIDVGSLQIGDPIELTYTDVGSGQQSTVTLISVNDPSILPLDNSVTADPNDTIIGYDGSGNLAADVIAINAALTAAGVAPGITVSNPAGTTLRFLDDSAVTRTVDGLTATATATSLTNGTGAMPFFVDGLGNPYTGRIDANGSQELGFAGRIQVNPNLVDDPSFMTIYDNPANPLGDSTRPDLLFERLTEGTQFYSVNTGIGGANPFSGSVTSFIREVVSKQGQAAETAERLNQGQQVVLSTLETRLQDSSGVNIDQEMAELLQLQTAYAANARILQVVQEMIDRLISV